MKSEQHWIVTADEHRATLYSCKQVPGGRWHIDEETSTENPWEEYYERHRPYVLGHGPTANAVQNHASTGHEIEEYNRRFANQVTKWLSRAVHQHDIEHVTVFAATRFLGLLRQSMGDLENRADLREAELAHLKPHQLLKHPKIALVLESPARQPSG